MVQLMLEFTPPASDAATEAVRKASFWFGALPLRWMAVDGLLLQKMLDKSHFQGIQAYANDTKAPLRFIKVDTAR